MNREEQLRYCKRCTNRKLDTKQGLVCNLTQQKATFTGECKDFTFDSTLEMLIDEYGAINNEQIIRSLPDKEMFYHLKKKESYPLGLIIGIIAGFGGSLLWAFITVSAGVQLGYMAIGLGALVGYAIKNSR